MSMPTVQSKGSDGTPDPTGPARLTATVGDKSQWVLLILLIIGVPTVFLRNTLSTFDIPQLTLLWTLAGAVALIGFHRLIDSGNLTIGPSALTITSACFLAALFLTSVLSEQPWVAFTGLPVRGAGALTYGLCLGLLHTVYRLARRRSAAPLLLAFVFAHVLVAGYALLQAGGRDPFVWSSGEIYVGPVFSTLGNANFSAGYLGLTLPILVWVPFGSRCHAILRLSTGAVVGASVVALAYLDSFQGQVAALMAILVLVHWAWHRRSGGRRPLAIATVLPVAFTIAGVPLLLDSPGLGPTLAAMFVSATCTGLGIWLDARNPADTGLESQPVAVEPKPLSALANRPWVWLASSLVVVAAGATFFGSKIVEQFESGLDQRLVFWRTSFSIFSSNPIVGKGLETYSAHFTAHRSLSHAIEHEFVLSDSAHSVPMGMLSGGGVLLAATYLALLAVILWAGIRAVKRTGEHERLLYGAVLAAWLAYHLQSLVSIDTPGLIYTQWVLGGVLLAGGAPEGAFRALSTTTLGGAHKSSLRPGLRRCRALGAALLSVALVMLLFGSLTAPLRADLSAFQAQEAFGRSDLQAAGDELLEAIGHQPRNGIYAEGMAIVYADSGLYELEFSERVRSANLRPGNPFAAVVAAESAVRLGRFYDADAWIERAVSIEPHGAKVLTDSAAVLVEIGRIDRALGLLEVFDSFRSSDIYRWKTVADIHRALGNAEAVERAMLCHLPGQPGCWPEG